LIGDGPTKSVTIIANALCSGCPMWSMLCDNACIPVTKRCDGVQDCVDASDEANCGKNQAST